MSGRLLFTYAMDSRSIISLIEKGDEKGLELLQENYYSHCLEIAYRILENPEDAEECVNETWLKIWEGIPKEKPRNLLSFVSKVSRNTALDLYRKKHAEKRGSGLVAEVLDELADCASEMTVEQEYDRIRFRQVITDFLKTQSSYQRNLFVSRYIDIRTISEIALQEHRSETKIKKDLKKQRLVLQKILREEGFDRNGQHGFSD